MLGFKFEDLNIVTHPLRSLFLKVTVLGKEVFKLKFVTENKENGDVMS